MLAPRAHARASRSAPAGKWLGLGAGLLLAIGVPGSTFAQHEGPPAAFPRLARWLLDVSAGAGQPVGDFADHVDPDVHVEVGVARQCDPVRRLGVRVNLLVMNYAQSESDYALPGITARVTTSNLITSLTAGPQLILGDGLLRVHLQTGIGVSWFTTETTVGYTGSSDGETNFEETVLALEGGGGLLWRVRASAPQILIGIGARYLHHGHTRYVSEDGVDTSSGSLVLTPTESNADLVVYRAGVTVGLASLLGAGQGE